MVITLRFIFLLSNNSIAKDSRVRVQFDRKQLLPLLRDNTKELTALESSSRSHFTPVIRYCTSIFRVFFFFFNRIVAACYIFLFVDTKICLKEISEIH